MARTAAAHGDDVTCLARGTSGDVPEGVRLVRGDRTSAVAYAQVREQEWDVVVDVSRQPGQVRGAVQALADRAGFAVFVSSINAYAEHRRTGGTEDDPLLPALAGDVMESMQSYGEAKVACEQHVLQGFGAHRALVARVGLIGGPGDVFDRTGYWPLRFSRPAAPDGAVLLPDAPTLPTQVVDVRDLAAWLVAAGRRRVAGVFNATGQTVSLAEHLELARRVAGHTGPVVRVAPAELVAREVQPWMGERSLPLWLDDAEWLGFNARDSRRARAARLSTRPLEQTLTDTLAWELTREPGRARQAGLSDGDERALLAALRAR